jgi:hypothetical protein
MATLPKARPPFAWLGAQAALVSIIVSAALGAAFRFWQLDSLPPGLTGGAANFGLQALNLADHGWLPGLNAANGYDPLWVWLQAIPVRLLGHTELALRLWPAVLGTLAVITTWLWVRSWFGLRLAWIASLLLAVTPWAVTLSRSGGSAVLYPLLVSLTLWVATVFRRRPTAWHGLGLAAVLALDLFGGPVGWLLVATGLVTAIVMLAREKQLLVWNRPRLVAATGFGLALAGLAYLVAISLGAFKTFPQGVHLVSSLQSFGGNLVKVLLMFNVRGDDSSVNNISGEPLLNAFVGLMMVAGILVGISRLHERRYRLLFLFTLAMLVPTVVTTIGVPNAAHAAAVLPLILTLAAVGVSYMLELWYRTFPINSAARAIGQLAIILLLGLTVFQGYTQYFRAWAGTAQVYTSYNEGAVSIASELRTHKFVGARFVVAGPEEQSVVAYLAHGDSSYGAIDSLGITTLPITPGHRQFLIANSSKPDAVNNLRLKFPGGILRPVESSFNQAEISFIYEVTK